MPEHGIYRISQFRARNSVDKRLRAGGGKGSIDRGPQGGGQLGRNSAADDDGSLFSQFSVLPMSVLILLPRSATQSSLFENSSSQCAFRLLPQE